ncbi:two-component regulator propeller domain-containing protein [Flectobacillus sp. DC10W]|uniref:histidine kinase n=1 Tax=Flectobacillus longus TaxID=2984207 RepID=A0ABT6YQB4_9BACT|nr:two-component regulator propeller domain-containing protein [Flectobacillus longus]MDI9865774.1 two-component regulator propeller domain-containing protein [Flectobacillus longus]
MKKIIKLLLALLLFGKVLSGIAQENIHKYRFEHITVNDGLPHSDANCIVSDSTGYIWIGTNNGVSKYDGYSLKNYDLPVNPHNGLPSNRVVAMHLDANKRLWVASGSAGLSFWDKYHDKFINVAEREGNGVDEKALEKLRVSNVLSISSDSFGRVWVGTRTMGLFMLEFKNELLVSIRQIAVHGTTQYGVASMVRERDGSIWIGTISHGLWHLAPKQSMPVPTLFTNHKISALWVDSFDNLWIGTQFELFFANKQEKRNRVFHTTLIQQFSEIGSVFVDSFQHLWVGTNHGLYYWEKIPTSTEPIYLTAWKNTMQRFLPTDGDSYSINSGRVHQILEDKYHNLWLAASSGGLNKVDLKRKPFYVIQRQFGTTPTLPSNYINSILTDIDYQHLWIGTRNGFSKYNLSTHTFQNYYDIPINGDGSGADISAFYQQADGTLWVGTRYNGLIIIKGNARKVITDLNANLSLYGTSIERIQEDKFGTIWIATFEKGLLRLDKEGKLIQQYSLEMNNFPARQCTYLLYEVQNDRLWVSSRDKGVIALAISSNSITLLKNYQYERNNPNSLSGNYAWPLVKDKAGNLWVGTIGAGLNKISPQGVVERWNLGYANIESMAIDKKGFLWLGGEGLLRLNTQNRQLIHYDVGDGLQSNSFKIGAVCQDNEGYFYFGGIKGITYFKPEQIQPSNQKPEIHLTTLRIYNKEVRIGEPFDGRVILSKPLDETEELTIEPNENYFSIEFVGINYKNPKKNQYAYKLVGSNDDWIYTDYNQRIANFSNLDSGEYTLLVKASDGEGAWSAKQAEIKIRVLPPWYKTWWAFLIYALVLFFAFKEYQKATLAKQALKNDVLMEKYKAEQEKTLTDLKLRFFTNVSHELRTPLTLILGPIEELASSEHEKKDKIMLILQQTRKLLDLVNQLLDFRKAETGNMKILATFGNIIPMIEEVFLIFKLKAQESTIDYTMSLPQTTVELFFDSSKFEIILTNLLSNAFKYTPSGGKISLKTEIVGSSSEEAVFEEGRPSNHFLQISIQDFGIGMSGDELDKIFDPYYQASHTETLKIRGTGIGLSLVKQLVEAHKGSIEVESAIGKGTTFTVKLPFGKKHLPESAKVKALEDTSVLAESSEMVEIPAMVVTEKFSAKILIVEDQEELRAYLKQICEVNYEVDTAVDGLDGWDKALEWQPDLIISDIMMPNSDGLELCQKIKQNPKTSHIPVFLLTARAAVTHEVEGLEMGADEYMAKPFNPLVLKAKIASILQNRSQLRSYYQKQILLEPSLPDIPDETKALLEKAMAIVEANLTNQEFTVQTLVRDMGMSQSAIYRQIKSITGQSLVEFIRDIRLKRAAQLLNHGNLRVTEVAMLVGIEDMKYFRKMFQQTYHVSPSEYAKQKREILK